MPYKVTRALSERKEDTAISSYVTASPVAPAAGHISIYVDLAADQMYREKEIHARIKDLRDALRDKNYARPETGDTYATMPIHGGKGNVTIGTLITPVADGTISIGIDAAIQAANKPSQFIDACIGEMLDYFRENG